jgi:hypothetical protein
MQQASSEAQQPSQRGMSVTRPDHARALRTV